MEQSFILDSFSTANTKTGKLYLNLKLKNKSGLYDAKMWDCTQSFANNLAIGAVYFCEYASSAYNGKEQYIVSSISLDTITPLSSLLPSSAFDIESMMTNIEETVENFTNTILKSICKEILKVSRDNLKIYPAAKTMHHTWVGGLLEHTCTVLNLAKSVVQWYKQYQYIKEDLLYAAAILHDIGKIHEYVCVGASVQISTSGVLTPHIVYMTQLITKTWIDLGIEYNSQTRRLSEELLHLICSHHGQLEWGSPVKPATLEAIILHHVDLLDAKYTHALMCIKEPDETNPELAKRSWAENVSFVIPKEGNIC